MFRIDSRSRTLFRVGLVAMVGSSLLQLPARHYPLFHPDLVDGVRGLGLGIFFGTVALTAWRSRRRAA
jgi:hypothetical protein